ncbi:acyl-CoA dehydrogenase family protein [Deltaproteobacteria bacterium TL4]
MANFYTDNEDIQFYIKKGIDWSPLLTVTEKGFGEGFEYKNEAETLSVYHEMLEMMGELAAEKVAPIAQEVDRTGIKLVNGEVVFPKVLQDLFDEIKGLDIHGMCVPRELGGMSCPMLLYFINSELLGRGDISILSHHGFHGGIAMAMLVFSQYEGTTKFDPKTKEVLSTRFEKEVKDIMTGEAWGCMDITEPDAGSDMAALRTKAEQDEKGNWFVTGQKIFITSGHGKYHFVIARTEEPASADDAFAGLEGLSFFLVPTYIDNPDGTRTRLATVERVEEKLGIHGSATCSINFDRSPAQLIGKRGEGFKLMLILMNNARVGVAFESLGICEASYRLAKDYAAQRKSMGKTIDRHEMIADYLKEMENDIKALRAITYYGAYNEELASRTQMALDSGLWESDTLEYKRAEKMVKIYKREARRVTPLIKYFGSEKAVELSRRCVQIHGGSGYTTEYGAEKLFRDAMVLPIYEGTSQIQSLMAMKDSLLGIIKNPQAFVKELAQARIASLSARDSLERRVARIQLTCLMAQQQLMQKIAAKKFKAISHKPISTWPDQFLKNWNPKSDFAPGMLHAERLLRLKTDALVCEILFEQSKKFPERREILETYMERAEPRTRFLYDEICSIGGRLLDELSVEVGEQKVAK